MTEQSWDPRVVGLSLVIFVNFWYQVAKYIYWRKIISSQTSSCLKWQRMSQDISSKTSTILTWLTFKTDFHGLNMPEIFFRDATTQNHFKSQTSLSHQNFLGRMKALVAHKKWPESIFHGIESKVKKVGEVHTNNLQVITTWGSDIFSIFTNTLCSF